MSATDTEFPNYVNCPSCSAQVRQEYLIPVGDTKICPNCKDQYAQRIKEGVSPNMGNDYIDIRQEHIKHEASLRSVGILYYLGGGIALLGGIGMLTALAANSSGDSLNTSFIFGIVAVYLVVGVVAIVLGRGFRQLKSWVRVPATILSALGLLSFPIGTLINGYILYLIWAKKGNMIFSPEYKDVIEATPDVKYKTSPLVWIILILLILFLVFAVGAGISGSY